MQVVRNLLQVQFKEEMAKAKAKASVDWNSLGKHSNQTLNLLSFPHHHYVIVGQFTTWVLYETYAMVMLVYWILQIGWLW